MANHVIYDRIWSSKKLPLCSKLAALAYPWIYLVADDHGRFEYLPRVIWGRVFGGREDITARDLERWLAEYEGAGLLVKWKARGALFAAWTRFKGRPPSRRHASDIPAPPAELQALIDYKEDTPDQPTEPLQTPNQTRSLEQEAGGGVRSEQEAEYVASRRQEGSPAAELVRLAQGFADRTGRPLEGDGGVLEEATRTPKGKALTTVVAVLACRRSEWLAVSIDTLRAMLRKLPAPPPARAPDSAARVDLVRELRANGNGRPPTTWDDAVAWLEAHPERVNPHSFSTWFRPTSSVGLVLRDPPVLLVQVPSEQFRVWIPKSHRAAIEAALDAVGAATELRLELVTAEEVEAASKPPP